MRIYICWGNYAGPHHLDIDPRSVFPHVANVKCKYVLVESANGLPLTLALPYSPSPTLALAQP